MSKKLYKVTLRAYWGQFYVVAGSSDAAYNKIKKDLDNRSIGTAKDRELKSASLIAEDEDYPNCEVRLYL